MLIMLDDNFHFISESEVVNTKIKEALQYKEKGNTFFKDKSYQKAIGQYHRALLFVKGAEQSSEPNPVQCMIETDERAPAYEMPPELKEKLNRLKVDCNNNLAGKYTAQCKYVKICTHEHYLFRCNVAHSFMKLLH